MLPQSSTQGSNPHARGCSCPRIDGNFSSLTSWGWCGLMNIALCIVSKLHLSLNSKSSPRQRSACKTVQPSVVLRVWFYLCQLLRNVPKLMDCCIWQDCGVAYTISLKNGQRLDMEVYLAFDQPEPAEEVIGPDAHLHRELHAQCSPGYRWPAVKRSRCAKGCTVSQSFNFNSSCQLCTGCLAWIRQRLTNPPRCLSLLAADIVKAGICYLYMASKLAYNMCM